MGPSHGRGVGNAQENGAAPPAARHKHKASLLKQTGGFLSIAPTIEKSTSYFLHLEASPMTTCSRQRPADGCVQLSLPFCCNVFMWQIMPVQSHMGKGRSQAECGMGRHKSGACTLSPWSLPCATHLAVRARLPPVPPELVDHPDGSMELTQRVILSVVELSSPF